jgi:hypothetical protein
MADGPEGYGQSSLIPQPSTGRRTGVAGTDMSGVRETKWALLEWGQLAAFATNITSKALALKIIRYSQKIVPFDTGELQWSAFVDTTEAMGNSLSYSVDVAGKETEGTIEFSSVMPGFSTQMVRQGNFGGTRTYTKYVCGYTAHHAAKVHENEAGVPVFHSQSVSGVANPFGDGPKRDHFLLEAYNAHKDQFSQAMIAGIQEVDKAFRDKYAQIQGAPAKTALSGAPGKPRLVKR